MSGADAPALSPEEASFADAEVERALAPYVGQLSAPALAWMREQLAEAVRAEGAALVRAAYPREVDRSGEVFRGHADATDPARAARRR